MYDKLLITICGIYANGRTVKLADQSKDFYCFSNGKCFTIWEYTLGV
jgi:hypothetical protein